MAEVLKKFGKYYLLDHIAQGGMAEIYRARLAASDGASRLIVIKKVIAGYGSNKEFLQMFRSEIKVTMGFNHPNIVQVYDFGDEQGQPYIAMEFIDGKSLRQFISRYQEMDQLFPIVLSAYIAEQCSSALHYAHSFKDKISGEPLNIVHRDISPQNILISYEGNTKVIDFGIAKATTNLESTRVGVIKGKPSYLSPEQISGDTLDGRSDVFALGTVLWELLTGKRLFAAENDLAVLKLIESCQAHVKAPSILNPKVPRELDYIVLRTLAKQREKRFQTAEELQRALHKFIYNYAPDFNPTDLSYYAKDLFKNEIVEDRKQIQKLNNKVEKLIEIETDDSTESGFEKASIEDTTGRTGSRDIISLQTHSDVKFEMEAAHPKKEKVPDRTTITEKRIPQTSAPYKTQSRISQPQAPKRRDLSNSASQGPGKAIAIAVIAVAVLSVFGPEFGVEIPIVSDMISDWIGGSEARLSLQGSERNVTVAVNGQTVASALPTVLSGIPVGTPFRLTVVGSSGAFQQDVTLRKGEKKQIAVQFTQTGTANKGNASANTETSPAQSPSLSPPPDKSVYLRLSLFPAGGNPTILVNGKSVNANNPVVTVPLDAPLELSVERTGYKFFKREFALESSQMGGQTEFLMDVPLEPSRYGFLSIHTTPSAEATISLDGGLWKMQTPIENEKLPVGEYVIKLTNNVLGMEKSVPVTIQEGRSLKIDERLEINN